MHSFLSVENSKPTPVRHHRARKIALVSLLVLAALLIAGRIALNPFVARHTRQVLASLKGYKGDFDDVTVSLYKLSYTLSGLKLVQVPTPPGGSDDRPIFYAKRIEIGVHWRDLIHAHQLVATVELDGPKINLIAGKSKESSQLGLKDPHIGDAISRLTPIDVQRITIKDAELAFSDDTAKGSPSLWLHKLDATVENLATRVGLARGEPTQLAASGTLQKTGQVSIFMTADPLSKALAFSGRASVEGLALEDVGNFLVQKADLKPEKGSIDLYAEFDAHDGKIAGGVKPVLKGVRVGPAKGGIMPTIKAWVADVGLKIFSDRVPGRDAVTTVIPIEGDLSGPKTDLWPTVWGVLRNAFVAGLKSGFAKLPPTSQAAKTGVLPQARTQPKEGHR